MQLIHGNNGVNFWEDISYTHVIQERPSDNCYVYYIGFKVIDTAQTAQELAIKYGFKLIG
jgi:hypothetical protein